MRAPDAVAAGNAERARAGQIEASAHAGACARRHRGEMALLPANRSGHAGALVWAFMPPGSGASLPVALFSAQLDGLGGALQLEDLFRDAFAGFHDGASDACTVPADQNRVSSQSAIACTAGSSLVGWENALCPV